jgi:hypothetical protein
MAKPFAETVNIQPQTISTGRAELLTSLSSKLDAFSSQQAQVAAEHVTKEASIAGKQAAAELQPGQSPVFKEEGFVGGIAKSAYNTALRSSYVSSIDTELTMGLSALKTEHGADLINFNDSANSLIKGTINGVDPASRDMILQSAGNFMSSARLDVQKATIEKDMAAADEALIVSGEFYAGEADVMAFNGDDLSSSEALNKVFTVNQSRLLSGEINEAQAAKLNSDAVHSSRVAKNRGEINQVLNMPNGIGIAAKAVASMQDKPLKGMDQDQHDALIKTLSSDISQHISLLNRQEVADEKGLKVRQSKNYGVLLADRAAGNLNHQQIDAAVRRGDISGTQFNTLETKLSSQGVGVTDTNLKIHIQNAIEDGVDVTDTVVNNWGSTLTSPDVSELLKMQAAYEDSESVLNTNNSKRARTFMKDSMKITGLMGRLTDDASKKTAAAVLEFDERVIGGEDAFVVANDLYDRDTLLKAEATQSNRHDVSDIRGAINKLNTDTATATINAKGNSVSLDDIKRNYNRDIHALQEIQRLQMSQKQFNDSMKEFR